MTLRDQLSSAIGAELFDETWETTCQACGRNGLVAFYEAAGLPTQTCVLLESEKEALSYPAGDLLLGFCETCGFIQNVRFEAGSMPAKRRQSHTAFVSVCTSIRLRNKTLGTQRCRN